MGRTLAIARPASRRVALRDPPRRGRHRGRHRSPRHGGLADLEGGPASERGHPGRGHRGRPVLRVVPWLPALRGAPGRPRCRLPAPRRPAGEGLRAARAAGALGPARRSGAATSWPGWSKTSTRCRTWSSGSFPPSASPWSWASRPSSCLWWMLPAAAVILAVSLVLAATVVPWLTGLLARRREARFAARAG